MTAEEYNKAATAREKRLLDKIEGMFKAAAAPKAAPPAEDEPDETEPDEAEENDEPSEDPKPAKKPTATATKKPTAAELTARKALQKATAIEKAAKEEKAALAAKEQELMAKQERSEILGVLSEAQSPAPSHALAVLKASGKIKRNDDGDLVFVASREAAGEKYDEELPLGEGIKEWLDSAEGKIYAPPKGTEGSGAGPNGKGSPNKDPKKMSKSERKRAAGQTLMNWALRR